jgi:type IV pilus assembly protein PilB
MILPETLRKILTDSGFIATTDFDVALHVAEDLKQPITDILVFRGLISEDALGKLIAEHYQVKYINLRTKIIPLPVLELISEQASLSFHAIPFEADSQSVKVGLENPQDLEAIEFIKRKTGLNVIPYYITPADFIKTIGQYKRNIKLIFNDIIKDNINLPGITGANAEVEAEKLPVIKILDVILEYASAEGASDVHFNAMEDSFLIRFRVDGVLKDIIGLPKLIHPALVARIKLLASLKIDERRIPQDGRFKFKVHESDISLRISIIPTFFGENVVMRLLPESNRPLSLEELGIVGKDLARMHANIKKPHGMVLVTGPTGSGKTTTLYSVLNMLNSPKINICTIEDPIEYGVRRVNQTQVNTQTGMSFAKGLRALLRHDPDVIMIGEIRDAETAEIAIHAALTGHLVLSTLHTNSAAGAIPRFLDMGVQSFLLASTLNIVIAQRLVRKICANCIKKIEPSDAMRHFLTTNAAHVDIADFFVGSGCAECDGSGYKGRVGLYEMLEVNKNIRDLISQSAPEEQIADQAVKQDMTNLLTDGLNKVGAGITTIEEVARIVNE